LPFEISKIIEQKITPTISTLDEARQFEDAAAAANRTIAVQVEIDTGMGRVGFWHEDALAAVQQVNALPHLDVQGVYTHFPSADENQAETRRELQLYLAITDEITNRGLDLGPYHAANSAAVLTLPGATLDLVRPGLLLYGIPPCASPNRAAARGTEFKPVLSFKARVAFVKQVAPGRTISYGQTFVAPSPMTIATVAAGYADGFSRHLSNHAQVLVHGRRCPVVGRVTMDQIMVDVTGLADVGCGDEVVFIGRQDNAEISALELARWADTIPWEVLCGITKNARVRRVYRGLHAA
jgi:alanine racemase